MPLQPGQMLNNRYRIVRLLGQGGFGAVYRAWDTNLNKPCALKENLETSPEAQRQFGREATVLANLSHPNLPRVTDHFTISDQGQYLVMDFVEGEDLASLVQRQGAVSSEQSLRWISQVADALSYLHSRKPPVLHRDIKPANIRITPEGRAMLVDFGLVKVYDPHMRTTVGARAVTPGYAPPEQYGQGNTDARTDIYALGATLYNLLTSKEPMESVQRMSGGHMAQAIQVNSSVPPPVSQAIDRAMALEPSYRYQNVSEFKSALERPDPTMVVKPVQESYVRPVAQAPVARPAPISEPKKRRGNSVILWVAVAVGVVLCLGAIFTVGAWYVTEQQVDSRRTSDAQLRETLAERVLKTSTAQVQETYAQLTERALERSTATAEARATSSAAVDATSTAQLSATEGARLAFLEELEANKQLVFGPSDGSLVHDEEDGMIEDDNTELDLRDFIVEARFFNPYPLSTGSWDYGFIVRHEDQNTQYRFVIFSDKSWVLLNNTGDPEGTEIAGGELPDLDISEGGSNLLKLVFSGERGLFYLENNFIAEMDISARMSSGSILVATGVYTGDEITGESTEYEDFTVWSIP